MALPTTRRNGVGGTCALGTAGAVYSGADITEWSLEATQNLLPARAKSDSYAVQSIHYSEAKGKIAKLVAAAVLTDIALFGTTHALTLTSGTHGSTGETVFTGTVVITRIGYISPDGMEAEDIDWVSTGSFVLA